MTSVALLVATYVILHIKTLAGVARGTVIRAWYKIQGPRLRFQLRQSRIGRWSGREA